MTDQPKTRNEIFTYRLLTAVFHQHPKRFFKELEEYGSSYLQSLWRSVAQRDFERVNAESRILYFYHSFQDKETKVCVIMLPNEADQVGPHFVALIYRPERRRLFFIKESEEFLAMFVLEKQHNEDGSDRLELKQFSGKWNTINYEEPLELDIQHFVTVVEKLVTDARMMIHDDVDVDAKE